MGKRKWPCEVFSGEDDDFYATCGHHADEAFLEGLLDYAWRECDPAKIERVYMRFIPIRGEPSDDTWSMGGYGYDEARNGYWFESRAGRGAIPMTRVACRDTRESTTPTPEIPFS